MFGDTGAVRCIIKNMLSCALLTSLLSQQAEPDAPFAPRGPELRYVATYRRATNSDYVTRTTRDKRVTYLKDFRVRVRLPGKTVTLTRPKPTGLIDVLAIGKDGSILYEVQGWPNHETYIWAKGKSSKVTVPGYQSFHVVGYVNPRNYYCNSTRSMGPKGMRISGAELHHVANGVIKLLGPGTFHREVSPGKVVAGAVVRKDGGAAGIDDAGTFELRLYGSDGFANLPGTYFLGNLPDGTLVTAAEDDVQSDGVRPVAEGDIPHADPRKTGVPRVSTIFHWRSGRVVRTLNVFGYPVDMNRKGQILLFEGHTDFVLPWVLSGDTVRPVKHDLPSSIRRFPFGFGPGSDVKLTDQGVITFLANDQADDTVVVTMRPK